MVIFKSSVQLAVGRLNLVKVSYNFLHLQYGTYFADKLSILDYLRQVKIYSV